MITPRIFTFWTGPQSPFIRLCLRSIEQNAPGSECWTLDQWQAVYDDRFGPWERIARLMPNQQSDILRAWLLNSYGGIWIDADCILFRDLRPLWQRIEAGADIVTYRAKTHLLCTALLAADTASRLVADYCELLAVEVPRLRRRKVPRFAAFGPVLFQQCVDKRRGARIDLIPQTWIHPLPRWGSNGRLHDPAPFRFAAGAYGFMLTHRVVQRFPAKSEEEIMASRLPVGQAFRRALRTTEATNV
jgi:hypothetical protein